MFNAVHGSVWINHSKFGKLTNILEEAALLIIDDKDIGRGILNLLILLEDHLINQIPNVLVIYIGNGDHPTQIRCDQVILFPVLE